MVEVSKNGQMELSTRVTTKTERSTVKVASPLLMAAPIPVHLETMRSLVLENIFGPTVKSTKDNGKETKCMGKAS